MSIEELHRALAESVQTLGMDHPHTLIARRDLARACYDVRDYIQAFSQHEQIITGVVRLCGADHQITVSALTDLAHVWFSGWLADKRPELAIPLFELAVAECMRVMGANDPATLSARSDLATVYLAAGQPGRAIAVYEQVLLDCVRVLGEEHSLTRLVRGNLRVSQAYATS